MNLLKSLYGTGSKPTAQQEQAISDWIHGKGEEEEKEPQEQSIWYRGLSDLMNEAKVERLEPAVELLSVLEASIEDSPLLAGEQQGLSVDHWLAMLNAWDEQLDHIAERKMNFLFSFFEEALEKSEQVHSPMTPMIQELVELIRSRTDAGTRVIH
ncbi:hypothetical protein ACQZV8_14155 [Magnetococcales bacterium HHB-1]